MSKTMEELYQEMREDFSARSGLSPNDGGDIALRLHACAQQLEALWAQEEWLERQCFPQTATGEYLERHAQLRGLTRLPAVKAGGTIRFCLNSAAQTDIPIPAGCVCTTAGGIGFETLSAAVIAAGSLYADVPAEAQTAGADGNVPASGISLMTAAPAGVAYCINNAAFSGGADEETDEALRERVLQSYHRLPNGANAAYYEAETLAVEGVAAAVVVPRARGAGTVNVTVSAADGVPGAALVTAVQNALNAQREICVDIQVSAATAVPVNVTLDLEGDGRRAFSDISDDVEDALEAYFNGALLGKKLTLAALGNVIYGVEGVKNYHITAPAADVSITSTQLPTLGTLTITEV